MNFNNIYDSPIDERDYIWGNICGISRNDVPDEFINPSFVVKDQKDSMWCMSFSSTSIWEIIEHMVSKGKTKIEFSPEFMMYNAKQLDDMPRTHGTTGRAVAECAVKYGFCPESLCPTTLNGEEKGEIKKPSDRAYEEALKHKPEGFARVTTHEDILTAIYKNGGVFTSLLYYSDMLNADDNGCVKEPFWKARKLGGHSTAWIGYSKTKSINGNRGFYIQLNSYGKKQGRFGLELVPFDIHNWVGGEYKYTSDKIFREAWTLFYKKNTNINEWAIQNQPKDVIKSEKPINMKFTLGSKIAYIDDEKVLLDQQPITKNGWSYLPIRVIGEAMDCEVSHFMRDGRCYVTLVDKNTARKIDVTEGWTFGYINGKEYSMPSAPFVDNKTSRMLLPVRAISDMLGCNVGWDKVTRTATITR